MKAAWSYSKFKCCVVLSLYNPGPDLWYRRFPVKALRRPGKVFLGIATGVPRALVILKGPHLNILFLQN